MNATHRLFFNKTHMRASSIEKYLKLIIFLLVVSSEFNDRTESAHHQLVEVFITLLLQSSESDAKRVVSFISTLV